ncbi:TetR/AcrR family transcriptional regulator [Leucobacter celer]|uniref:TetR/AcrR family transcriptional regulator n=1 Tax=Leucobacter celer TaxID=668625 RepID=UPI0006A7B0E9|nr:TetR/AcrR family transcriptional regulator [Leucobacter celer]
MARPRKITGASSTRERMLRESARLFTELGYEGTSTRAITEAVEVKQPSLFHYFSSKEEIGHELVRARIQESALLSGRFQHGRNDPPLELYLLFRDELVVELNKTTETGWLFRLPPRVAERFPEWGRALQLGRSTTRQLLSRGIDAGQFIAEHPAVVLELLDAIANEAMFWRKDSQDFTPDTVAKVLLRLVIADQQELARVVMRSPESSRSV